MAAPIVRRTIIRNELMLMRSSMMMVIFVNFKMKTLMEKQMTSDSSEEKLFDDGEIEND